MNLELLSELCETPGPSGREERIRRVVRRELEPLAEEVSVDPLGNLVARRPGGGGPRLMLSAHMDEIGFMVTHVDDGGLPAPDHRSAASTRRRSPPSAWWSTAARTCSG